MDRYILSIDQGTTSCRAIVFDKAGRVLGVGQSEFTQHFPKPGWVEHDASEILETQIKCVRESIKVAGIQPEQIACVGLTNQRETAVLWERSARKPVHRAIVWQCRRTQDTANELKETHAEVVREKTGLVPDAYFSGPKIDWILKNSDAAQKHLKDDNLSFGTIDTWLITNLTEEHNHLTDPSNASRTMLYNINELKWDPELLKLMGVPARVMPSVVPSDALFGHTSKKLLGFTAPILGVLGDQQAALFGQACLEQGMCKCTYGTGSFILGNIGEQPEHVHGLLTTIAWQLENAKPVYALEGANFVAGAAIQWLRDGLQIITSSEETEAMAESLSSNEGVYFVPALVGLGSPWWESQVRGMVTGLTRGSGKAHFVRAALEAMAYQIRDIAEEIKGAQLQFKELRVDGGATKNNFLMQFQADLLNVPVKRAQQVEATAWGVAALAGIKCGLITKEEFAGSWQSGGSYSPKSNREADYAGWQRALSGARSVSYSS